MSLGSLWVVVAALWAGCLSAAPWGVLGPAALALLVRLGRPPAGMRRLAFVACGVFVLGVGLVAGRAALADRAPLARLAREGGAAEIEAVVVAEPRATRSGAWTIVRVSRVGAENTRARALLHLDGLDGGPAYGDRLVVRAEPRPLEREGFGAYLRRLGVATDLRPRGDPRVVAGPGWVLASTNTARTRARDASRLHLNPDDAALLTGLVTGDTAGQSAEREAQFDAAGLSHLVAVSGSNVALVLAGVLGLGSLLRLTAPSRRAVAVVALAWFVILVRAEPSVLRAAVMALLVLAAQARGRGADARYGLGAAALVLLLADPLLAGQLGFVLSLGATAGVLVLGPALTQRLPGPRALRRLIGTSVGAQLGVTPVLLTLPDGVPLAAVPANVVAVPAAAAASAVGVAAALLAQVSVQVGGAIAVLAWPALRIVAGAAAVFARGPRLSTAGLALPALTLLVVALLLRRRAPRLAVASICLAVAAATVPALAPPGEVTALTVTVFDVGQGDAVLVEAPTAGGATARLLVDGGPEPGALPHLRARRVRRLDAVAMTHAHADHSDGLPAVLRALEVGALLVGPRPLPPGSTPSALETYAAARGRAVPIVPVSQGARFALGTAIVDVLSPPGAATLGEGPNDDSLVLRVDGAGPSGVALLPGDAEVAAQEFLLRVPEELRADLLKVPHHGGDTNTDGFLGAVQADIAVVSAGEGNRYGHPDPAVLAALAGAALLRTDQHGDVRIVLAPERSGAQRVLSFERSGAQRVLSFERSGAERVLSFERSGAQRVLSFERSGAQRVLSFDGALDSRHAVVAADAAVRRTRGAAAAAGGGAGAGRVARAGGGHRHRARAVRPASRGPPRAGAARPADRLLVRLTPRAARA